MRIKISTGFKVVFCVIFAALPVTTACQRGGSGSQAVKVIKFSHVGSNEDVRQLSAERFKKLVEQYTDSSVAVEIYGGGQLGGDRDAIEGVKFGTIQMTVAGIGIFANFEPKMSISSLPYLFKDYEQAWKFTDSATNAEVSDLLLKQGIRVLAYWGNGFRCLTNSKRPITSLEDIRGLTIRTPENPIIIATLKALGANASPLPWPELYMALQQKSYDGQENPLHIIYMNKLYEVQKYLTLTNHIYESMPVVINDNFWNSLSQQQQDAVRKAIDEVKTFNRNFIAGQNTKILAELEQKGMVISKVDLGPFREATEKVRKDFAHVYGEKLMQKVYRLIEQP